MSTVNINTTNNTVSIQDTNQEISVTDNNKNTTVSIPQTNTNIVQVNTPGPQGPVGPQGTGGGGSSINTGSFATTGSNVFVGNQTISLGGISLGGDVGLGSIAIGDYSTSANGESSLAQGTGAKANGYSSHAEGSGTTANGEYSHTEGDNTQANGNYSHAEGQETKTLESAQYSHAEGYNTIASANYQHVQGQWNATSSVESAFIVGNGTDNNNRSNLIHAAGNEVQITGTEIITGSNGRLIYTGTTPVYPYTLAEVHINDDYPWLHRFYNDTFSTSSAVMAYFGYNDGRFVFHNESTQSIGLQVNGFGAENGLLVYSDKVAFVNNVEVTGSLNALSITGSLQGTASFATQAISSSFASTASFAPNYLLTSNTSSMLTPYVLTSVTSSFTTTSSFNTFTSSINNKTGSFATTGSNIFIGNQTITGSLTVSSSANTQLLIGTNALFVSGSGNVGIGTITPGVKLDVFGTGQIINMGNGTSTDAYIDFAGNRGKFGFESATGIRFQGTNTRPIVFALGNWGTGEIARFSTQGFFGLNTNNPSAWLHISGTVASSSLLRIDAPGSSSIFEVSGSGVVTINGSIPVTRNATGYNVGRFTNSASFDNIRVAISSSGNPVASSVSGSVNVYYNTISSVVGSAISSSVNTGAIFTTGSWSLLTSATLGSGGDTITSHIQDQDRGRLYRATFIQTAGPTSGSVVIERLI